MEEKSLERAHVANKVSALALFVVLACLTAPWSVSGNVARYSKYTPISASLTLRGTPGVGRPIRVAFDVESEMDLPDVEIEFLVPDAVMLMDTDTIIHTSMKKGEKKGFIVTTLIVIDRSLGPGGRFIWALAKATASDGRQWSAFSVAGTDGVVQHGRDGRRGADSLRAVRKLKQPTMQEIEEVRDGIGLPDDWDYTVVAAHLWYSELRLLWQRGYSREESFRVMQDLSRYLARKRGITRSEAAAAIVNEGLFGQLMERRDRLRAFYTPGKIAGITAIVVLLLLLVTVALRRSKVRTAA